MTEPDTGSKQRQGSNRMGQARLPPPELLIVAAFSRHDNALHWARERLVAEFGPIALQSEPYAFTQTAYYEQTMGAGLSKLFFVFERLVDKDRLAGIKLFTNALEDEWARIGGHAEPRPVNLDPGLLGLGKLVLATTKDQAHRIYLRDGIYAEVTLRFEQGEFVPWPHTYADYRLPEVGEFLKEAREYYRLKTRVALGHE